MMDAQKVYMRSDFSLKCLVLNLNLSKKEFE